MFLTSSLQRPQWNTVPGSLGSKVKCRRSIIGSSLKLRLKDPRVIDAMEHYRSDRCSVLIEEMRCCQCRAARA